MKAGLWLMGIGFFLLVLTSYVEARDGHHLTDPKTGVVYNCYGDECHRIGRTQ